MFEHHPIKIIGFDLGEEKTALAQVLLDNEAEPESFRLPEPVSLLLHKQKSQINAIAYHPKQGTIIGERASLLRGEAVFFEIRFQKWPSNDPAYQRTIRDFVKGIYEHLIDIRQIEPGDHNHFFVGCPSGWLPEEIRAYQELLSGAGLPNVTVVRNSRVALMQAAESGMLKMEELNKSVLVIELGFFTTNYTLVNRTSDISIALGIDLGTSQLDKAILKQTLASYDNGARLEEIFEKQPLWRKWCELSCRRAREEYFSAPEFYEEPDSFVPTPSMRFQRHYVFEPLVNGPIMEEILDQPMPELGGRSWVGTFRHQLKAVKQRLNQQGIKPAAILLTGEGSQMGFVHRICAKVFPNSPYRVDSEPELCIAKGLARWGRGYINTERFLEEVNQFAERELPTLIEKETSGLIGSLAEALADGIVEEVLKPRIKAWRNGYIKTLNDLEGDIKSKVESWLNSSAAKDLITEQVVEWLKTIQMTVYEATEPIYRRYGLPRDTLGSQAIDLSTDTSNFRGGITIGDPTGLSDVVAHVVTFVTGVVIAVVSEIIVFTGILGIIVGIVALGVGLSVGEEWVKSTNLYQFIRNFVSDNEIKEMGQEQKSQLSQKLSEMLNQHSNFKTQMIQFVTQRLKRAMEKQAENRHKLIMFHV